MVHKLTWFRKLLELLSQQCFFQIEKLQRALKRQEKHQKDLATLLNGHYPPGVRPFTPGSEPELDGGFLECGQQGDLRLEFYIYIHTIYNKIHTYTYIYTQLYT